MADQQTFTDKNKYPFALWCDTELKLIKALGIQMPGRDLPQRVTFVVDKQGVIRKIIPVKDIGKHPQETLEFVKTLK